MRFTQIIDFRTSRLDELMKLQEEWRQSPKSAVYNTTAQVTQDRDDPEHCVVIITFDSYDEAMANSNLPETNEWAQTMQKLADGPPKFINLDVLKEESVKA